MFTGTFHLATFEVLFQMVLYGLLGQKSEILPKMVNNGLLGHTRYKS